jgi:hypothetical protein
MGLCLGAAIVSISHMPFRRTLKRFTNLFGLFAVASSAYMWRCRWYPRKVWVGTEKFS